MTSHLQQKHEAFFRLQEPRSNVCVRVIQDTTKVNGLGGEVWAGALVLCEFLDTYDHDVVIGRDVIELGAGCGLCGLVAASLGANTVVLTDEYPDLLEINITKNRHLWAGNEARGARPPIVSSGELEWGLTESLAPFVHTFDTMLGSEITQLGRDLHVPLLETIRCVLRPKAKSVALLSMDPCRAACVGTCDPKKCSASHFVTAAKQQGFTVHKHASVRLASREVVGTLVGALGRPLHVHEDDYSVVFELRLEGADE
uniref:Methyltransferase small domain-containing protein n=1 Tax=Hyaloperonospora arabidopsidis (strain Emoy2) TaxID=559515 RepID=M4BWX7_HYAAE